MRDVEDHVQETDIVGEVAPDLNLRTIVNIKVKKVICEIEVLPEAKTRIRKGIPTHTTEKINVAKDQELSKDATEIDPALPIQTNA